MAARNIIKLGALEAPRTAFLLCDVQETFRPHVKHFGEVVKVANKMVCRLYLLRNRLSRSFWCLRLR